MSANFIYKSDNHSVILFSEFVKGHGIQSNQFLVIHDDHSALIDPGGYLTYTPLTNAVAVHTPLKKLDLILASHQDPDIISSLGQWITYSDAKIYVSKLWERFIPHLVPGYMESESSDRIIPIPDEGMKIELGGLQIYAVPAHFLHSVGNFHFYDPVSKILFSGDVGASLISGNASDPVEDFDKYAESMTAFHKRYMGSNRALRLWVNMVRGLNIDMIVPQHGHMFSGKETIEKFLNWLVTLDCGVDNISQQTYMPPLDISDVDELIHRDLEIDK